MLGCSIIFWYREQRCHWLSAECDKCCFPRHCKVPFSVCHPVSGWLAPPASPCPECSSTSLVKLMIMNEAILLFTGLVQFHLNQMFLKKHIASSKGVWDLGNSFSCNCPTCSCELVWLRWAGHSPQLDVWVCVTALRRAFTSTVKDSSELFWFYLWIPKASSLPLFGFLQGLRTADNEWL